MASLADLQTERETLRAAQAKQDFEAAHAETCAQSDLIAAGAAVRAVLLSAIDSAAARFLDAIRGERDETRVHYLMSDAAHDLLGGIGEAAVRASAPLPVVGERLKRGVKPRDLLTVSQWADRHREMKSGTNAPGRWHTSLTPYLEEILVFFEAELLGTGLAAFLAVLLLDRLLAPPSRTQAVAVGVVGALAVLTRPDLALCAVAGVGWLAWRSPPRSAIRTVLLALAGAFVVLWPAAAFNHARTGHAGLLPPSGGINLYVGNHPDFDRTIAIRPGLPWEELIALPQRETRVNDPWVSQRWFRREVTRFLRDDPFAFAARLGAKALHAISSRELTRNVDVYLFREWSSLLAGLVWKIGPFGFPFGALLPLAVAGCVLAGRRLPAVVWLLPAVHLAGLALVFVAARYRVVGTPWLAVAAAWALVEGAQELRRHNWRGLAPAAGAGVVALLLATVPGPFAQEAIDTEPEMWHSIGINRLHRDNDLPGAEAAFREAITLRPDFPEAQNRLGVAVARQGRFAESIPHFESAIAGWPAYEEARRNLANARELAGT